MERATRILLVEDDRDLAVQIQMALSGRRWDVEVVRGLGDALERLRVRPAPDVLITELALHDGPPVDRLLEEVARDPALRGMPTVLLSAWEKAPELAALHGIPRDRVLARPLDLDRLPATLERIARSATGRVAPAPAARDLDIHRTGAVY